MNQNWARWITASINKYCQDNLSAYDVWIEGSGRNPSDSTNGFEIRINGPTFTNNLSKFVVADLEIDILVKSISLPSDRYIEQRMQGLAANVLDSRIPIYQYNDSAETKVGCLRRESDIDIRNFGQLDLPNEISYSTVVASYQIDLEK